MEFNDNSIATRRLIEQFYSLFSSQDFYGIAAIFSDYPDWYIPGNEDVAPWLGTRSSKQEIIEFFQLLFINIEPVSATIQHIFVDGDQAIATGEFASRMFKTGKIYESMFFAHFTIQDNLIIKYRFLEDSYGLVKSIS